MADEYVLEMDEEVQGEGAPVETSEELITEGVTPEPTEPHPTPAPPPPAPAQDNSQQRIDEINRQMGALQAQYNAVIQAHRQAQPQRKEPKPEEDPRWPKEEDWARDPNDAARRQWVVLDEIKEAKRQQYEQQRYAQWQRQQQQHQHQQQRVHHVRQAQAKSFQTAAQLMPELMDAKTPHRKIADTLFNDPSTGLRDLPAGAFLAAAAADTIIRRLGEQRQDTENSRVAQVKKGAMTASGKRGKTTGVNLSRDEEEVIRQLGVSKESYIKAKKDFKL